MQWQQAREEWSEKVKKINRLLTLLCEEILEKIHWKNTKSNQWILSGFLGNIVGYFLLILWAIFS